MSPDYGRIVNERHFDRLTGLLDAGGYDTVVIGGERDAGRPLHRPDGADRRQARRGGDGRGDLRADPAGARRTPTSTRRCVRQRPAEAARPVRVRGDAGRNRPRRRATRRAAWASTTRCCTSPSPTCRSAASARAAWAPTTARPGSTFLARRAVFSKPTKPDPSIMYPPYKRWKQKSSSAACSDQDARGRAPGAASTHSSKRASAIAVDPAAARSRSCVVKPATGVDRTGP